MTKALALEWARYGIRVNALAPGYFETELNDDFFGGEFGVSFGTEIVRGHDAGNRAALNEGAWPSNGGDGRAPMPWSALIGND